jgi:hypothetical protein
MPNDHLGDRFAQRIDEAHVYFTHYALFQEPDPGVPAALYLDAATQQQTTELVLTAPINQRVFTRQHPDRTRLTAPPSTSKLLPYVVSPPGFPPLPTPDAIAGLIARINGLSMAEVSAATTVLLVAIGQFLAEGETTGRLDGANFEVQKTMRFQVRIRTGFIFTPPTGAPPSVQAVAVLTGYLDMGFLHQLIQLPPPPDPTQIVLYDWKAPITLSTRNVYVRPIAKEPKPVADPFPTDITEIRFEGQKVGDDGRYTIVGHAAPAEVQFSAPPELEQFLFGTSSLADVEFAVMEAGELSRL